MRALRVLFLVCVVRATTASVVVQRALTSASRRAKTSDSICHGTLTNHTENVYMSFARRRATEQASHDDAALRTLYTWCRGDRACCTAHYMKSCGDETATESDEVEFETFRYLTTNWYDHSYPLTQLLDDSELCGGLKRRDATENDGEQILDNVLRKAWTLEMRLQTCSRRQTVHCAENQRFIYSPTDNEGHCVCGSHDVECHAMFHRRHTSPWTYSLLALIVCSVAVFVLVSLSIYQTVLQISILRKLHADLKTPPTPQSTVVVKARSFISKMTDDETASSIFGDVKKTH